MDPSLDVPHFGIVESCKFLKLNEYNVEIVLLIFCKRSKFTLVAAMWFYRICSGYLTVTAYFIADDLKGKQSLWGLLNLQVSRGAASAASTCKGVRLRLLHLKEEHLGENEHLLLLHIKCGADKVSFGVREYIAAAIKPLQSH